MSTATNPLPAKYYEKTRCRRYGWTVPVTPLQEYRLLRHWMGRDEHRKAARALLYKAATTKAAYSAFADECLGTFGDHGPLISGVLRDHFPPAAKDRLRALARGFADCYSASLAHWQASGRRVHTWRRLRDTGA
jgi:hypothetical protein